MLSFTDWAAVKPHSEEFALRQGLFKRIERQVRKVLKEVEVCMFGSTASCLALRGSDIDVLIFSTQIANYVLIDTVHKRLLKVKAFDYVEAISAQVPILKLRDNKTGLTADIAFNRKDGVQGCLVSATCFLLYPEMRPLYLVVKAFLRERDLDQTRKGGVCSFMLVNMVVYFL